MKTDPKATTKHIAAQSKTQNSLKGKAASKGRSLPKKGKESRAPQRVNGKPLANILEWMSDGFVAFDAQMNYTYINERSGILLGRRPEDLIGKNFWKEFPESIGTPFADAYRRALETQAPIQFEDYHTPSGRWLENRVFPTKDGLSIFYTDVTERRREAEERMRESEETYRALIDQATAGITRTDPDGRFTFVNRTLCEMLGYTESDLLGKTIWEITHPDDVEENKRLFERMMSEGTSFQLEKRLIRRDGSILWVNISVSAMQHTADKPQSAVSVVIDISGLKQVEQSLRKSKGRLLATYEHAPIGIVENSLEGNYVNCNEEFCRITGYEKGELLSFGIKDLTYEEDYIFDIKLHQRLVAGDIPFYKLEKRYIRKDGEIIWAEVSRSLMRDADGKPLYTIGAVLDVSERRRAENEVRRLNTELQARLDEMNTLLEILPTGVWIGNQDSSEITGNPAAYEMLSLPPGTNVSVTNPEPQTPSRLKLFVNGEEVAPEDAPMQVVARSGKPWHDFEQELLFPDGTRKAVYGSVVPLLDGRGKVRKVIGTYTDFTERKRVQEALRESEERFRALVSQATAGIAQSDLDSRLTFVNPKFCEMLGYPESELIGKTIWELTYADDLDENERLFEGMVTQGQSYQFEKRFIRRDGSTLWTNVSVSATRDAAGRPNGGVGVVVDITARKQAETQLQFARDQAEQTADRIARLQNVTAALSEALTPSQVAQVVVDQGASALGAETATMLLLAEDGEHLEIVHSAAPQAITDPYQRFSISLNVPAADAARSGQPVWIESRQQYLERYPHLADQINLWDHQAAVAIPMLDKGRTLGVLALSFDRILTYTPKDQDYALTLAQQGAQALERARLYEAEQRARQAVTEFAGRQEVLYTLADQLHRTNSPEDVFNAALDAIISGLQCDRASILLFDNTNVMRFVAWRGLSGEYRKATQGHSPWKPDEKNAEPIAINDINTAELSDSLRAVIEDEGIGSLVFIPLVSGGKLIGKFMAYFNAPHVFSEGELDLSLTVARQLAFGIERNRAEEALRASEALYRAIARSIPGGGVYVVDKDLRYLVAEGPVTEAFGLSPEMLEGYTVSEVFPTEAGELMKERLQQNFAGETISYETKHNGRVYWTQQAPLLDSLGHAIVVTIDITERKQMEEALRQSEERFVRFMQHLPGPAWIKDMQGRYVYANAAAEKAFSTPQEELYGKTDQDVFPPGVAAQFKINDEHALTDGKGVQVIETLEHADGILHYSLVNKFPIPGPDGNTALIGGTAFDITERKQAEEALHESKERYHNLFDLVPVAVYSCDADGLIQEYNHRAIELWGREPQKNDPNERYCGSFKIYYPDGRFMPHEACPMARMLGGETLEPHELEILIERPDGVQRSVIAHPLALKNEHAEIIGAINCLYDITERKQAEEKIVFQANLLSAVGSAVIATDLNGTVLYWNPAAEKLYGWSSSEAIGKNVVEVAPAPPSQEQAQEIMKQLASGKSWSGDFLVQRRDGSTFSAFVSDSPFLDSNGKLVGIIGVSSDITELKQAEEALQQLNMQLESRVQSRTEKLNSAIEALREEISERKRAEGQLAYQAHLIANVNDAIIATDADLAIGYWNQAAEQIYGWKAEEVLGRSVSDVLQSEFIDGNTSSEALRKVKEAGEFRSAVTHLRKDGTRIFIDAHTSTLRNEEGKTVGYISVNHDVTERTQMDEALRKSRERLQMLSQRLVEVQEEERRAIARELHDRVGQTLAALNINLMIMNGQIREDSKQLIGSRMADTMHLVAEAIALVRNVMTDLRPAVLDDYGLEAALQSYIDEYKSRYNIKVLLDPSDPPLPRLGPSLEMTLLRITQEALFNIARHAQADTVNISLRLQDNAVHLMVQDNGVGIQSWQEANRPGSHGLTIMRERADAFGGRLNVGSAPGKGTKVEVSIPLQSGNQNKVQEEKEV